MVRSSVWMLASSGAVVRDTQQIAVVGEQAGHQQAPARIHPLTSRLLRGRHVGQAGKIHKRVRAVDRPARGAPADRRQLCRARTSYPAVPFTSCA